MTSGNTPRSRPSNITIKLPPGPVINLTCYGFHLYAEDFLSAERVYGPVARKASLVPHFLCCQSVELSLKAFLSLKGMTRKDLRKRFGHNLTKLYKEACLQGIGNLLTLSGGDASLLGTATEWYDTEKGKRLQYFSVVDAMKGFRDAPDLAGLEDLASRLQSSALRDAVLKG